MTAFCVSNSIQAKLTNVCFFSHCSVVFKKKILMTTFWLSLLIFNHQAHRFSLKYNCAEQTNRTTNWTNKTYVTVHWTPHTKSTNKQTNTHTHWNKWSWLIAKLIILIKLARENNSKIHEYVVHEWLKATMYKGYFIKHYYYFSFTKYILIFTYSWCLCGVLSSARKCDLL